MNKKWELYDENIDLVNKISNKHDISKLLAKILVNRGITEDNEIEVFLNPTRNNFHDPFLMPDMEKSVERIIKAIKKKERVLIYGDYDVDGITSTTVLRNFLKERGLKVDYYIPNRLDEGYGLNRQAVKEIISKKYKLMITVDCGISGIEEIEMCNKNGIETIITDHHEQLDELPNAYAIINAKRRDSKYPFRGLAGVGVVFKLIQALSIRLTLPQKEYLKYLDLVCVGTISDIVPLIDENRVIAKLGLELVKMTSNIGLKELIRVSGYKKIDSNTISFGVAPRINACGRMGCQIEALRLFLSSDTTQAKTIMKRLNRYNAERQLKEREILDQAIEKIEKEDINNLNSIVLSGENWHHGVIGIVASKLTEKYYKPAILISFDGDNGKGSGRSIVEFDLHGALVELSRYLNKFGGHGMAVGLSLNRSNFEEFKRQFEAIASKKNIKDLVPVIKIDSEITKNELNRKTIEDLERLEPFGEKNKTPVFLYRNLRIDGIRTLAEGKHLKMFLRDGGLLVSAIGFNLGYLADEFLIGEKVDIVR